MHLETIGPITQLEAINLYGVMRLSGRIWDLRAEGVPIVTEQVAVKNRYGNTVHVARYRLAEEGAA